MTDPGDGSPTFDPRYDPRFQPGYVPVDDDATRFNDDPELSRSLSPVEGKGSDSPEFPSTSSGNEEETISGSERKRHWFNRFHLVLWVYGAVLLLASIGLRVLLGLDVSNNSVFGVAFPNLLWNIAPVMLPAGLIALVGVLILSTVQRRRPRVDVPARRAVVSLSWPASLGLWILALLLIAAAGVSQVWNIRQTASNSTGQETTLSGFLMSVVLNSLAEALFLTGCLAVIALVALGIRHQVHNDSNPYLKGMWIGSVLAAFVSAVLLGSQVPGSTGSTTGSYTPNVPDIGEASLQAVYTAAPSIIELSLITIVGLLMFHAWTWRKPS